VSTGKVKFVLRDFPLESLHKYAFKAAEATHCASEQGKYWEMHEQLFAHQNALSPTDLLGYAQALGLDVAAFQTCVESGRYAEAIRKDMAEAQQVGFTGTPSFVVGVAEGDGNKVKVLRVLKGAQAFNAFKAAIDSVLEEQKM
jgi:protein-disulfide isomerase